MENSGRKIFSTVSSVQHTLCHSLYDIMYYWNLFIAVEGGRTIRSSLPLNGWPNCTWADPTLHQLVHREAPAPCYTSVALSAHQHNQFFYIGGGGGGQIQWYRLLRYTKIRLHIYIYACYCAYINYDFRWDL